MKIINVARDYTPYPGGRYPDDGPGNGTDFRENFLVPILENHDHAIIVLDGAYGYPSSFLEEAFGGLVRRGFDPKDITSSFDFEAKEPGYARFLEMISRYINSAKRPLSTL